MSFAEEYLDKCKKVVEGLDAESLESAARHLALVRERGGRLFIIGSGGGAGHASHAVCDFRKLCRFEAYAPYDNVSELTARVNDDGWESTLRVWLEVSRLSARDALLVFSVGGGSKERNISMNLVSAIEYARQVGASVVGIVGRDGGFTAEAADACVIIPTVDPGQITSLTEGFQSVVWHLLVSHPGLKLDEAKWESTADRSG